MAKRNKAAITHLTQKKSIAKYFNIITDAAIIPKRMFNDEPVQLRILIEFKTT